MTTAADAGDVMIGDLRVHRIGYGTMRLTGPGIFGPPPDLAAARETLRIQPELGVNLIDTSNAYGPLVAEMLVRDVLYPYAGLVIATKGGLLRPGPNQWVMDGRPEALRAAVENSCKLLGVARIDLWQLHRPDDKVPYDEQCGAIAELQRAGLIRHVGLSNVSAEQIDIARKYVTVASVQDRFHIIDRGYEPVLEHCERLGIPFISYFPLAMGGLARDDSMIKSVADRIGCTPGQAALAWLLKRSKWIVVIPGTTSPAHARENVAAAAVRMTDEQFAEIDRIGRKAWKMRGVGLPRSG